MFEFLPRSFQRLYRAIINPTPYAPGTRLRPAPELTQDDSAGRDGVLDAGRRTWPARGCVPVGSKGNRLVLAAVVMHRQMPQPPRPR